MVGCGPPADHWRPIGGPPVGYIQLLNDRWLVAVLRRLTGGPSMAPNALAVHRRPFDGQKLYIGGPMTALQWPSGGLQLEEWQPLAPAPAIYDGLYI